MISPVKRHVGPDRAALLAFAHEAHRHGYRAVVVAVDVAEAFGAPTSTPIMVTVSQYMPAGLAVAFADAPLTLRINPDAISVWPVTS